MPFLIAHAIFSQVDIAYEGVGGPLLGAICKHLRPNGRVLVVGSISQYPHNQGKKPSHGIPGLGDDFDVMRDCFRPRKTVELPSGEGRVLIGNVWGDAFAAGILGDFRDRLYADLKSGALVALVDTEARFEGVSQAPEAVNHMLSGANIGKVVLRMAGN